MPERYLNLHDETAMADFMESVIEFLPESDRAPYQQAIDAVRAGNAPPKDRLAEMAKNIGAVTWPARKAFDHFLDSVGSELEWEAVMAAVRPTTALLLKRIRDSVGAHNLDQVLASDDASYAILPEQEIEIDMVREEVRLTLWNDHRDPLEPMAKEALTELEAMKKRLKSLRDQAVGMNPAEHDLILRKIDSFEDRIYFGGEIVPLEVLDDELRFDADDAAIPPSDTALE